jgi:hypothetical protein
VKQLSQWRTVIAIELLGLDLLAGLWLCSTISGPVALLAAALFTPFTVAIAALAAVLGGKSAVEHLGNGSGVKGAVAAIMSDAKPGEETRVQS